MQDELFNDMPHAANPRGDFLRYRVGKKIVEVPYSIWKDGRIRGDLSAYGGGTPVSRNRDNLDQRIIGVLEKKFGDVIEAVREELKRKPVPSRPRASNKLASRNPEVGPREYINPFCQPWIFAPCPDWLFSRREPSPTEKNVYATLLFPIPPGTAQEEKICKEFNLELGVILDLNQSKLAHRLGVTRQAVNLALRSLEARGLIEITGGQGVWGQTIRFLRHPWMPENTVTTCPVNGQVGDSKPVCSTRQTCRPDGQVLVRSARGTCNESGQVSQEHIEREKHREERESENSPSPVCPWAGEPHIPAAGHATQQ